MLANQDARVESSHKCTEDRTRSGSHSRGAEGPGGFRRGVLPIFFIDFVEKTALILTIRDKNGFQCVDGSARHLTNVKKGMY